VKIGEKYLRGKVQVWILSFENARPERGPIDLPKVMYHVSPGRYLEKIRRNGIVPKSKSSRFDYPERTYLFGNAPKEILEDYGREKLLDLRRSGKMVSGDEGFHIFLISRESVERWGLYRSGKVVFYVDPFFSATGKTEDSVAIFTYDVIPPGLIGDTCVFVEVDEDGEIGRKKRIMFR
jgi:hypothetical protein